MFCVIMFFSFVLENLCVCPPPPPSNDFETSVIFQICEELGVKSPSNIKLFTGKSKYMG